MTIKTIPGGTFLKAKKQEPQGIEKYQYPKNDQKPLPTKVMSGFFPSLSKTG